MAEERRPTNVEEQRLAELQAGRNRFAERANFPGNPTDLGAHVKRADQERNADEERRRGLLYATPIYDQATRDIAGAEVADQAQTELEALQHLADRNEPIIDFRRERLIERQQGDADPAAATATTMDHITAQAVNQPTVLAHEAGQNTEDQPLNTSGRADNTLALDRQQKPSDAAVPKTRAQAVRVAKGKTPPAAKVVKEQAVVTQDDPEKNEAVAIVAKVPNDVMGPPVDGTDFIDNLLNKDD